MIQITGKVGSTEFKQHRCKQFLSTIQIAKVSFVIAQPQPFLLPFIHRTGFKIDKLVKLFKSL